MGGTLKPITVFAVSDLYYKIQVMWVAPRIDFFTSFVLYFTGRMAFFILHIINGVINYEAH